jgi:hypothetical protein
LSASDAEDGSSVATKAPRIPSNVVRMKPDGSLGDGWISFAMKPAMKPMMMIKG